MTCNFDLHVDFGGSADKELQLISVEYPDPIEWYKFAEPRHERIELILDAFADVMFDEKFDILLLILFGNFYAVAARLKLKCFDFSVSYFCD